MKNSICGTPFYLATNNVPSEFPWLDRNTSCDVAIIGGGIAGAMAAYKFSKAGINVALLSNSPIGYCTTSASEGVATSNITGGLTSLSQNVGGDMAVKIYREFQSAVNILEGILKDLDKPIPYRRTDSLIYSDTDANAFNDEYDALEFNNINVQLLNETTAREKFSFPVKSALLFPNAAIECDPYLLTHSLCYEAYKNEAQIYENTLVSNICQNPDGKYTIYSEYGKTVIAQNIIIAAGLETAAMLDDSAAEKVSFCLVSRPVSSFGGWTNEAVIAKMGCDNIRLRTTPDKRIIINGLDCGVTGLKSGIIPADKMATKKYAELHTMLQQMFPQIPNIEAEYNYAVQYVDSDFTLTKVNFKDNVYYDMCPAENGIVYSVIISDMLISKYLKADTCETHVFEEDLAVTSIKNTAYNP